MLFVEWHLWFLLQSCGRSRTAWSIPRMEQVSSYEEYPVWLPCRMESRTKCNYESLNRPVIHFFNFVNCRKLDRATRQPANGSLSSPSWLCKIDISLPYQASLSGVFVNHLFIDPSLNPCTSFNNLDVGSWDGFIPTHTPWITLLLIRILISRGFVTRISELGSVRHRRWENRRFGENSGMGGCANSNRFPFQCSTPYRLLSPLLRTTAYRLIPKRAGTGIRFDKGSMVFPSFLPTPQLQLSSRRQDANWIVILKVEDVYLFFRPPPTTRDEEWVR